MSKDKAEKKEKSEATASPEKAEVKAKKAKKAPEKKASKDKGKPKVKAKVKSEKPKAEKKEAKTETKKESKKEGKKEKRGRWSDPRWTLRRLIPTSERTLLELRKITKGSGLSPMQLASYIIVDAFMTGRVKEVVLKFSRKTGTDKVEETEDEAKAA